MEYMKQNCPYSLTHSLFKESYFYLMDEGTLSQALVEKKDNIREEKRHLRTYSFGPWLSCMNIDCNSFVSIADTRLYCGMWSLIQDYSRS